MNERTDPPAGNVEAALAVSLCIGIVQRLATTAKTVGTLSRQAEAAMKDLRKDYEAGLSPGPTRLVK